MDRSGQAQNDLMGFVPRGFILVWRLEIGLEMDMTCIKKGAGNDTEPLVFIIGSPTGA